MDVCGKRAFELMQKLGYERVSGTDAELRTAEAIKAEVDALGIQCELEEFEVEDGIVTEATLTVLEPYVKEYNVTGYIRSASTPDEGLTLDFTYVENGHPLHLQNAKGKAALINGRVSYKNYEKLQKAGVAAIIGFSGSIFDTEADSDLDIRKLREVLSDNFGDNVLVNVRIKDAMEMVQLGASKVNIKVKGERKKSISHNVCATIPGTERQDEIISFGAHYDSVHFSSGVYDNMSGSAIIMEALRYFAEHPPRRTLKFNWYGSEEQGLLGSKAYVKAHGDELEKHVLMINVDVAGPILGYEHAYVMGADTFKPYAEGMMSELGKPVHFDNGIYSSDSIPFADNGVPAINFAREGVPGGAFIHDRRDNLANGFMSADALAITADIVLEFAKRVVDAGVFPIERKISDSIRQKVDEYLFKKKD